MAQRRCSTIGISYLVEILFDVTAHQYFVERAEFEAVMGVVDQIRRLMAVPQPVDTTQFTGWRTGIPSPISLFITFTPARISPTWAL